MVFQVIFKNNDTYAVARTDYSNIQSKVGIDLVNKIREKAGCNVPLDRIITDIEKAYIRNVIVTLDEEVVYRLNSDYGLFSESNELVVNVSHEGEDKRLGNDYLYKEISINRDGQTGEVTQVIVSWEFDRDEFVKDWMECGCPLEFSRKSFEDATDEAMEAIENHEDEEDEQ